MPVTTPGRPFNTATPLGKILYDRDIRAFQLAHATGINARTVTEYLAGRKPITRGHRALIADFLNLHPDDFDPRTRRDPGEEQA